MDTTILFEDESIIVCVKKAGIPTETKAVGQQDMISVLKNYRSSKNEPAEIHAIHRLDQMVEGVMVFAKNDKAAALLSRQVKDHTFIKKYYAIINRESFPAEGKLEDYVVKDMRSNISRVVKSTDPRGKKAELEYKVIYHWDDRYLLDINLLTGRHHQIRLQLASRTAPIIGDVKYGGLDTGRPLDLCSYMIGFIHPVTGEALEYTIIPQGQDFVESGYKF